MNATAPGSRDAFFAVFDLEENGVGTLLAQQSLFSSSISSRLCSLFIATYPFPCYLGFTPATQSMINIVSMNVHPVTQHLTLCVESTSPTIQYFDPFLPDFIPKLLGDSNREIVCLTRNDTYGPIPDEYIQLATASEDLTLSAATFTGDAKFHLAYQSTTTDNATLVTFDTIVNTSTITGSAYIVVNQSLTWRSISAVGNLSRLAVVASFGPSTNFTGDASNTLLTPVLNEGGTSSTVIIYFDKVASGGSWVPGYVRGLTAKPSPAFAIPIVSHVINNAQKTLIVGGYYRYGSFEINQLTDPDLVFPTPTPNTAIVRIPILNLNIHSNQVNYREDTWFESIWRP